VGAISIDPSPPGWGRAAIPAVGKLSDGTARVAGITLTLGHLRQVSLPSCGQASPGQLVGYRGPDEGPRSRSLPLQATERRPGDDVTIRRRFSGRHERAETIKSLGPEANLWISRRGPASADPRTPLRVEVDPTALPEYRSST